MKIYSFLASLLLLGFSTHVSALPNKLDYPHWNFQDKNSYTELAQIDEFINAHKNKGYVAVFDWDGTLYNEKIPFLNSNPKIQGAGQSAWHQWAANHLYDKKYIKLYPMFITNDGHGKQYLIQKDNLLEGRTSIKLSPYAKYTQIATLEAGMSTSTMVKAVNDYLKSYPTNKYLFYPVMDIMQKLVNSGYHVWIVTGSNPYFIAILLHNIEKHIRYTKNKNYHLGLAKVPYDPNSGHIAGNSARLSPSGKFTAVYDDRYTKNASDHQLHIVDGEGKEVAIRSYIEKREKKPVIFYAGNSSGDLPAMRYLLQNSTPNAMALAVNPQSTLKNLATEYPKKIVILPIKF